jgi:large subunit ribosomal protein L24
MKLKKGDKVKVIAGKDKTRDGVIDRVYKKQDKVMINGINMYKKHVKKSDKMPQGGIVDIPRPIDISKIMLICPKCNKTTRVACKIEKDMKHRVCKKCQSII